MSRQTFVLLTASVIVGVASLATASTDALAAKKAVHHRAATAAPAAAAPVTLIDNNYGPVADGIPKCLDSVIRYPSPPCY
jgi:cytochrome oxidase Cu insertion factor (SCO1/SenC/PrrC family)